MTVLGVMSGTSLDGLDLALCSFCLTNNRYEFEILKAETVPYTRERKEKLMNAKNAAAIQYLHLSHLYGKYIAAEINRFLKEVPKKPAAIASHGHTVFHQPASGFTSQIGCGATIAALTGITTVCDFRSMDVALGGQGAPLVPVGDKLLFGNYGACLNLGGIANISFDKEGERKAFDICFANMGLNFLAEKAGKAFDANGEMAASGKVNHDILRQIRKGVQMESRISLSREIFEKALEPVLDQKAIPLEHRMASFTVYVAEEIAAALMQNSIRSVFVTGGGAYNAFLIEKLKESFSGEVIIPDDDIIQFKEALIFAFLGYLRLNQKINTLKSVTGASDDSIGGAVYRR